MRLVFVEALGAVSTLLRAPELVSHWGEPSALDRMSVGALAGHLLRATVTVENYLDAPEPDPSAPGLTAAAYLVEVTTERDLDSDLHRGVRERAEASAAGGPDAVRSEWDAVYDRLAAHLPAEPAGRRVAVFGGLVLPLDEYLRTRLVEICVHADDLATSLGFGAPPLTREALAVAVETLVAAARLRHDDTAVLRALTRRERDAAEALRVL